MTRRKQPPKDLTGIRQRGSTHQVRISGGYDPVTGRQLFLTGSADTEDAAIVLRDQLRRQVQDATAARTNVTLGYVLEEWLSGRHVEETTRSTYRNPRELQQTGEKSQVARSSWPWSVV